MYTFLVILHVIACVALILVVLLQKGKGADLGAAFGGSSQTVFGGQGAGGFLTRLVAITVAVFLLTSLALAYISSHRVQATIMESPDQTAASTEAPAAPTEGEQPAPTAQPPAADEGPAAPGQQGSGPAAPEGKGSSGSSASESP